MNKELRQILVKGAEQMSVVLQETQIERLLNYIGEFDKWNKAYNLSAIRDIRQMVTRHLLDSLSVVSFIEKNTYNLNAMVDVGTGGGLPGIPLAIMFPEKKFTLLDSNGKKTRFLFHIKTLLQLDNVTIENRRVEEFQPEQKFDAVISRAFASLQDMTEGCVHLLQEQGVLLAMKGLYPGDELNAIENKVDLLETLKLNVAETDGERHLLVLKLKNN